TGYTGAPVVDVAAGCLVVGVVGGDTAQHRRVHPDEVAPVTGVEALRLELGNRVVEGVVPRGGERHPLDDEVAGRVGHEPDPALASGLGGAPLEDGVGLGRPLPDGGDG